MEILALLSPIAFVFSIAALAKVNKLEKDLKSKKQDNKLD